MDYPDKFFYEIFEAVNTIAMVGASANWVRPSHFAMKYLQSNGFRVIPVNPSLEGKTLLCEPSFRDLSSIPGKFEMVDVFRSSDAAGDITDEAINLASQKGIKVIWMQLGVLNFSAAKKAEKAGLRVVMDRCPKIEYGRLFGELGWNGVNTGVLSSKRLKLKN